MQEELHIDGSGNVIEFLKKINSELHAGRKSTDEFQQNAAAKMGNLEKQLRSFSLTNVHTQIQNVNQGLQDLNGPGLDFNSSLAELSALTGTTGAELDALGDKARASAKEFGGNAASSIEVYKTLLGRLGPDIAKNQNALALMEKNVQTLSKTMGGDAAGAVDALTTGMLQYGVDLSDPITAQKQMAMMMDVMANSAQAGAAEVPQISAALKVAGVQAKLSKVSFAETNAAIQALAQGGKEGSEAGVALRNVLGKMAGEDVIPKEAADKLKALGVDMNIVSDTSLPFTDRLRELKKAQGDATIMAQVFGTENAAAANILLSSVDAQDKMTASIQKTGGAQAQAEIVMESTTERIARMKAQIDDAKLAFFEATGGVTAYLGPITEVMGTLTSFAPIYNVARTAILSVATATGRAALMEKAANVARIAGSVATKVVTAATWLWNAALNANPIGLVIGACVALGAAIYAVSRAFSSSTAAEQANAAVKERVIDKTAEESAEVHALFSRLRDAKVGTDEYKSALQDLDSKYPGMIEKYNLHKGAVSDINRAEQELIRTIEARAEAEANMELYKEAVKNRKKEQAEGPGFWDQALGGVAGGNLTANYLHKSRVNDQKALENEYLKRVVADEKKKAKSGSKSKAQDDLGSSPALATTSPTTKSKGYSGSSSSETSQGAGGVKSISVRIEQLVGSINITTQNISESAAEIRKQVAEALTAGVRDFEVSI